MKRKLKIVVLIMLYTSILTAQVTELDMGSVQMAYSENVGINKNIDDDFIAVGDQVRYTGVVDDLFLLGRRVNFKGNTTGSIMAFAETVTLDGEILKNLYSLGENIRINGHVKDTCFILGESIVIAEDAIVDGTLFTLAKSLNIVGQLNNGLVAGAGELVIDGEVYGDVNVDVGKLVITERGSILGNLSYSSDNKLSEAEKSRISGTITLKINEDIEEKKRSIKKASLLFSITTVLTLCLTGLLLLLLPGVKSIVSNSNKNNIGKSILWGLIPIFIFPVLIVISVPLLPLSILLALVALPLLGLSIVFGLTLFGEFIFKRLSWQNRSIYVKYLLALGGYTIISFIPVLNVVITLGVAALGSSLIVSKLFKTEL